MLLQRDVAAVTDATDASVATATGTVVAAISTVVDSIAAVCEQSSVPLELHDEVTISLSISC